MDNFYKKIFSRFSSNKNIQEDNKLKIKEKLQADKLNNLELENINSLSDSPVNINQIKNNNSEYDSEQMPSSISSIDSIDSIDSNI